MKYKHLIYDFDGTVSDTYPCFTHAFLTLLDYYGMSDSYESAYAKLKVSVGYAMEQYPFPEDAKTVSKRFNEYHRAIALEEQMPYSGAAEILAYARATGRQNFLYTHSGRLPTLLMDKWGILQYFSGIIDSTYNFPRKPAPDALNFLCDKYSLDRTRSLMIGDRDIDVECGINAGMSGCLFDDGHYYDSYVCDIRINSLGELKEII